MEMLVDAHCHLDRYVKDLDKALAEINGNRIFTISNSMDIDSYKINMEISKGKEFQYYRQREINSTALTRTGAAMLLN